MKKTTLVALILFVAVSTHHQAARAQGLTAESLGAISKAFKFFLVVEGTGDEPLRYVYADVGPHIHVYSVKKGRSVLEWESTNLGSSVVALLVKDVESDGSEEIVVATAKGRIIAYDKSNYELLGENFLEPFETISCLTTANIDEDPQDELIFIAESFINIYDSQTRGLEWKSQDEYQATEIVVANVDDDEQLEIILNTGVVIDSRFYYVEPNKVGSGSFGARIRLLDINGDGYPEIIGETSGFSLKIYDLYAQRELW